MTSHRSRVVGVVTSFNPSGDLITHCAELQRQVSKVVVVDDESDNRAQDTLDALETSGAYVVRLRENLGIGHAINVGTEEARNFSPEFVVTFDQDSSIQPGYVDALVDEYDRVTLSGVNVGMVAPNYYAQTAQSRDSANLSYLMAIAPIQSGALIPVSAIDVVGKQKEEYFIDAIDTEYFLRIKKYGFEAICAPKLRLTHTLGSRVRLTIFGVECRKSGGAPRTVIVSAPFRYYYRARNRIMLLKEYREHRNAKSLILKQFANDFFIDFNLAVLVSQGKLALMRVILAGWRDGFRGRTGKIPPKISAIAENISWRHPVSDDIR
jgi:rhamnosyltransferase